MDKINGSELYDYIIRTFKRTDKSQEVYDEITNTLTDMCERMGFEENKVESYTTSGITSIGDYKIDLPANFSRLIGDVRWSDGDDSWTLTKLSKRQFNEMFPDPDGNDPIDGEPTHYCLFGKKILLGPVPDSMSYTYMLDYAKFLDNSITSLSTDVMFTDNARECIKYGTLARLFESIEEFDKGGRYAQKYEIELSQFVARETNNTRAVWNMPTINF